MEQDGWHWRHLLLSPHRPGFLLAMLVLAASSVWWAGVQLTRLGVLPAARMAIPPSLVHAATMTFGFFPLFFCGFLFTTGPRWLHVRGPATRDLLPALLAQAAGWLIWLVGSQFGVIAAVAGLALAAAGLSAMTIRFWGLIRASSDADRVHPIVIAGALTVGCGCIGATAIAVLLNADGFARLVVLTGVWACVTVVFVTAGHRMIPFFSAAPGTLLDRRGGGWWQLALLVGVASFEAVAVWLEEPLARLDTWQVVRSAVELVAGSVLLSGAVAWSLAKSLRQRLLRMLHTAMVWIALGLVLKGAAGLLTWWLGAPVLPLAALHAFAIGGLGTVMLAMVTRVSAGHAGIPAAADDLLWVLFWLVQLTAVLRVAAAVPKAPMQALLTLSALVWAGLVVAWGLRYGAVYGRPAAAGGRR